MPKKSGYEMTDGHKARLAEGREHSRLIRNYIETIQAMRGRRRSRDEIEARLAEIKDQYPTGNALIDLKLASERDRLEDELRFFVNEQELASLQGEFVKYAAEYGKRKGITYNAWREVGVPASVLQEAGITRANARGVEVEGEEE